MLSILKQIAGTDSTKEKESIIKLNSGNDNLKNVFRLAYHPRIKFGFSKKTFPVQDIPDVPMFCLTKALELLESEFSTRKVTGHAARDRMQFVINQLSVSDAEVVRRVVLKDLEIGAGHNIANKVWKNLIPEQPQQNCSSQDDELIEKIIATGRAVAEIKADGSRMFLDIPSDHTGEEVNGFTRGMSTWQQIDLIRDAVLKTNFRNWVVDGEMEYTPTGMTGNTAANRKKSNGIANKMLQCTATADEVKYMKYKVWDIIPRDVYWGERECPVDFDLEKRRELLEEFAAQCAEHGLNVEILDQVPITSVQQVKDLYKKYRAVLGYEGLILKFLGNVWKDTRTDDYVKFKAKEPIDVEIIGVYPHRKDPEKVGGFVVRTACGRCEGKVGSGFKDKAFEKVKGKKVPVPLEQRHELDRGLLWSIRHKLIGTIIEIEANEPITSKGRKPDEPEFSFYLPVITRLRPDKTVANKLSDVFKV